MKDVSTIQEQSSAVETRDAYQCPRFERKALILVTLGGSPGTGDSGAPTTRENIGFNAPEDPDEIRPDYT